jgi:hypothetical protein
LLRYLQIYNEQTGSNADFPLLVASKIYWEAKEFTISGNFQWSRLVSAGGSVYTRTFTAVFNETIQWGQWGWVQLDGSVIGLAPAFGEPPLLRTNLTYASELVCSGLHTNYRKNFSVTASDGAVGTADFFWSITNVFTNSLRTNLHAPIFWQINIGSSAIISPQAFDVSSSPPFGVRIIGNCSILTPWGNAIAPIQTSYDQISDGTRLSGVDECNVTITVTGADPSVRYS